MTVRILTGDCVESMQAMEPGSVHCCVTSPPYFGLRDYGRAGQIGLEATPDEYVAKLVAVFREVRRVLRDDGTLWLNLGDSYVASACGVKSGGVSKASGLNGAGSKAYAATLEAGHGNAVDKTGFGLAAKNLIGIPWRVAFALQADGWWLRQDIIWSKPNPMPESVTDRCTKAHEYVFMLSKSARYFYDQDSIKEPATYSGLTGMDESGFKYPEKFAGKHSNLEKKDKQRGHLRRHAGFNERWDGMSKQEQGAGMRNKRSVWTIATKPYSEAHFATMAPELAETCIKAGCPVGGTVLDPFGGAGTTGLVADRLQRSAVLCELNAEYVEIARRRIAADAPLFAEVEA